MDDADDLDALTEAEDERRDRRGRRLVESHVAQLREHFDSVQIFVTCHLGDHEGTVGYGEGAGNYYARVGQVRDWLEKIEASHYGD